MVARRKANGGWMIKDITTEKSPKSFQLPNSNKFHFSDWKEHLEQLTCHLLEPTKLSSSLSVLFGTGCCNIISTQRYPSLSESISANSHLRWNYSTTCLGSFQWNWVSSMAESKFQLFAVYGAIWIHCKWGNMPFWSQIQDYNMPEISPKVPFLLKPNWGECESGAPVSWTIPP